MGIVAAKLALAWFHMLPLPNLVFVHLSLAVLSGAVLSGATQSSGSRLVRRRGVKRFRKLPIDARPNPTKPESVNQNQSKFQRD
jgi:hypothetical protein